MEVLYEDNHLIAVNKPAGLLAQGDMTGDTTLSEEVKKFLKEKYNKPGNVFAGLIHRIDRPVSGVVLLAKTSKALERMNEQFKSREVEKTYWAITENRPDKPSGTLKNYLEKKIAENKSHITKASSTSKEGILDYELIHESDNYFLLEVKPKTGRHHQIRVQLASIGCPIKGDIKYGSKRTNKGGSICLHARKLEFTHPVSKEKIAIVAPVPNDGLWKYFESQIGN